MTFKNKKIMKIEGMSCGHCQARVEKALSELTGVAAKVNLRRKSAEIEIDPDAGIDDQKLMDVVKEAGYTPVSIEAKRGLFR